MAGGPLRPSGGPSRGPPVGPSRGPSGACSGLPPGLWTGRPKGGKCLLSATQNFRFHPNVQGFSGRPNDAKGPAAIFTYEKLLPERTKNPPFNTNVRRRRLWSGRRAATRREGVEGAAILGDDQSHVCRGVGGVVGDGLGSRLLGSGFFFYLHE